MINISDDVKILINTSVMKNYRIHFIDNELRDLTIKDYVEESFTYSESINSGNSLDFGSIEIPTFSVSVINIDNIKGKKVLLTLEYFCESNIENSVYKEDLDSYVYEFSLGEFIIDSCEINKKNRAIRSVRAFGSALYDSLTLRNDYIAYLSNSWFSDKTGVRLYVEDIKDLYYFDSDLITNNVESSNFNTSISVGEHTMSITGSLYKISTNIVGGRSLKKTVFYRVFDYYKFAGNWNTYISEITKFYKDITDYLYGAGIEYSNNILKYLMPCEVLNIPTSYSYISETSSGSEVTSYTIQGDFDVDSKELKSTELYKILDNSVGSTFHLYLSYQKSSSNTKESYYEYQTKGEIRIPLNLTVTIADKTFTFDASSYIDSIYTYEKSSSSKLEESDSPFKIDIARNISTTVKGRRTAKFDGGTGEFKSWVSTNVKRKEYSADVSVIIEASVRTIMQSYAELQGQIGRINRNGKFVINSLKSDPVETITLADYFSFSYDEVGVKQIGKITLNYHDIDSDGDLSTISKELVSGYDSNKHINYIVSGNWILDNSNITQEQAEEIINNMSENMQGISYVSCELSMIARPDLEVGDFINVKTSDNTFVTCIMKRTLKGIIALKDNIECKKNDGDSIGIGGSVSYSSAISGSSKTGNNVTVTKISDTNAYYVSDVTYISDSKFSVTVTDKNDGTEITNIYEKTEESGIITLKNTTNGLVTTFKGW